MLKSSHFQKCIFERLGQQTCQAKGRRTNCTDLLGKKKGKKKKKRKKREKSQRKLWESQQSGSLEKPGPRGECCSPDESLAERQHQREDLNGFVLAESRAAGCSGKAALWDGHVGTGRMSAEKLGIREEISHHLWKVHRMPL